MSAAAATGSVQPGQGSEMRLAVKHTAVYGMGSVIAKALGFLMVPFYTHYLSPASYGVLEVLDLTMSLLGMFLNMGMTAAMMRSFARAESEDAKRKIVSTALLFATVTGVLTFTCMAQASGPVSRWLFGPAVPSAYLLTSFATFVLAYVSNLPRTYLRALEASSAFVLIETVSLFAMLGLNVLFIAVFGMGLYGILLSSILVTGLQTVILCWWAVKRVGIGFDTPVLKEMVRFGAPLVFSNLGIFTLNFSDRFFLQSLQSLDVVGVYAVGYKFGYMLNYLLVQPFYVMWEVRMYVIHRKEDHAPVFGKIFVLYSFLLTFAALGMALLSPEIVRFMVDPRFADSRGVIPIVAFAYVFNGIGFCAQAGMLLARRTSLVGLVSGTAAVLNLAMNAVLIRLFGMLGAAWATLLSFLAIAAGSYWCSQRVFPLPLGGGRVVAALIVAIALYVSSLLWVPANMVGALAMKVGLMASYLVLLWKMNLLNGSEKQTLVTAWDEAVVKYSRVWQSVTRKAARS